MPFNNTPGVPAQYGDGAFKQTFLSAQPKVLLLAPASSGLTDEMYVVTNLGAAEAEFGAASELCKGMHEVAAQGADNIVLMRTGGKQGLFVVTDSDTQTLTITPAARDLEILERYALIMEEVDGANRVLVYDLEDEEWVYDSLEILTINGDELDVDDTGVGLFTIGDKDAPQDAIALADIVSGDFTPGGSETISSVTKTAGADGTSVSLVEKYAALNRAYYNLDYRDADYVIPKGVFIDSDNIADGATPSFFKGVPVPGSANDALGYLWQYEYQGALYTYFVDQADFFSETQAAATVTINTNLVITAARTGTGGNGITVAMTTVGGTSSSVVTITEPALNTLHISIVGDNTVTNASHRTAINAALAAFTMQNGALASTLVSAVSGGVTTTTIVSSTPLAGGQGGHYLDHQQLTGDSIPSVVSTAFAAYNTANSDATLRECNFAHQLASFCYQASTTWKTMQGAISVAEPSGYSRADIASWVGTPPEETQIGLDLAIDVPGDNGSGLFGIKLMAGKAVSSNGYRAHMIEDGDSTDGYLYGGIIATKGLSLPNGDPRLAYGIDDGDEAEDFNGFPIDIGKHIHVTVDWPVHRNAYNGGNSYRGSIECSMVGLLCIMPENEEPIGLDWPLKRITQVPRVHASQRDALNKFRFCNLRFEEGVGWVFGSARTAAHKLDSDYTRQSTIRCVNRELTGIRAIAKKYIGKPFSSTRLANLQSDIDSFLFAERRDGFNNGAVAVLSYTRAQKILGKLDIRVRMVPPFTLEEITEILSLAAEEADLTI